MVETRLEPEVISVFEVIAKGKKFLLSGGAGSGKTYSLVQVIKKVIEDDPANKIACMTYTNAAVKEIEERVNHSNLSVTTIHDFLWDNIKSFQKELKKQLILLINDDNSSIESPDGKVAEDYFEKLENGIQYKEWTQIKEGIISHDEVIELSLAMFTNYRLLCDIIKDRYKFIFIDEYQDTHPAVVEIFLTKLKQSNRHNIIGFFGDSMQSIYDDTVGDLKKYIDSGDVVEILKAQNRRNPLLVIQLANKLRNDGLIQQPSDDQNAPNMFEGKVKEGNIKFIHSRSDDLSPVRKYLGWNFDDSKQTKELNLTHRLISNKAGFNELMEIYNDDPVLGLKADVVKKIKDQVAKGKPFDIKEEFTFDQVVDIVNPVTRDRSSKKQVVINSNPELYNLLKDRPFIEVRKMYLDKDALIDDKKNDSEEESKKGSKRDNLIKHLFKIQRNIFHYRNNNYNEFLRLTDYPLLTIADKIKLKEVITTLEQMVSSTIGEVIDYAHDNGICIKDDRYEIFAEKNFYLLTRVRKVRYEQFEKLYNYLEGYTPFSTQHKIKGAEFENVLVILDNGKWRDYNFEYLFRSHTDSPSVLLRTQKIFYVCCTRSKSNLAVFFHNPDAAVLSQAKKWFGEANIIEI